MSKPHKLPRFGKNVDKIEIPSTPGGCEKWHKGVHIPLKHKLQILHARSILDSASLRTVPPTSGRMT